MTAREPGVVDPAARPAVAAARPTPGVGQVIVLVSAIAIIVSSFLNWEHFRHHTAKASDVGLSFLWDYTSRSNDPSLILILAVSAVLCVLGAVLAIRSRAASSLALLGALLAIGTAVMYSFQVHQAIRALGQGNRVGVIDFIGVAPIVTFAGGIAALIGALILPRLSGPTRYPSAAIGPG